MKIYSVITAVAASSAPAVFSNCFTNIAEARAEFRRAVSQVDEGFVTIHFEEFDTSTGTIKTLEFFSGNEEDLTGMPAA